MKFGQELEIDTDILVQSPQGAILEITFHGIHDHMWPHGNEINNYVQSEIAKHKPVGVLINFLHYQYSFGNEIWGPISTAIFDFKAKSTRPCAIVASGITLKSIESLFDESNIRLAIDFEIFKDKDRALRHLEERLFTPNKS